MEYAKIVMVNERNIGLIKEEKSKKEVKENGRCKYRCGYWYKFIKKVQQRWIREDIKSEGGEKMRDLGINVVVY